MTSLSSPDWGRSSHARRSANVQPVALSVTTELNSLCTAPPLSPLSKQTETGRLAPQAVSHKLRLTRSHCQGLGLHLKCSCGTRNKTEVGPRVAGTGKCGSFRGQCDSVRAKVNGCPPAEQVEMFKVTELHTTLEWLLCKRGN